MTRGEPPTPEAGSRRAYTTSYRSDKQKNAQAALLIFLQRPDFFFSFLCPLSSHNFFGQPHHHCIRAIAPCHGSAPSRIARKESDGALWRFTAVLRQRQGAMCPSLTRIAARVLEKWTGVRPVVEVGGSLGTSWGHLEGACQ